MRTNKKNLASICLLVFITLIRGICCKKVLCYYNKESEERTYAYTLKPQDIDLSLCTHLVYSCTITDLTDNLLPTEFLRSFLFEGGATEFADLKRQNENLSLVLSIGGWKEGSMRFSKIASRLEEAQRFARQAVDVVRFLRFDGFDINWQWPGLRQGGSRDDKNGLQRLIRELKDRIKKDADERKIKPIELSLVLPPFKEMAEKGFHLEQIHKEVDYLVLMTMDYHLPTDPFVNHHAPLYYSSYWNCHKDLTVASTVQYYLDMGIEAEKMILGIPLYGNSYVLEDEYDSSIGADAADEGEKGFATKVFGILAYFEICKYVRDFRWSVRTPNHTAMGPYAYLFKNWVAYDDPHIVTQKVKFAMEKCLGGVMLWTIDMDDFKGMCHDIMFPLAKAVKQALLDFEKESSCHINQSATKSILPTSTNTIPITTTTIPTTTTTISTTTTVATATTVKPFKMVTRVKWDAKPPTETINSLRVFPPKYVIIGHTVSQECTTFSTCKPIVQNTQDYHLSLDYGDIGFNFMIGGDGNVYEGLGWNKHGAHNRGFNGRSLGVSFIGDFSNVKPPEKQIKAALRLLDESVRMGELSPDYKVFGQSQVSAMLSPGKQLMAIIKTWPHWSEYDPIEDDED